MSEDDPVPPFVSNAPRTIYLNVGDIDEDCDFSELSEVLWCEDEIGPNDIPYIRLTEYNRLRDALDHIARVAKASRTGTHRYNWIAQRAQSAIDGNEKWRGLKYPKTLKRERAVIEGSPK